MNQKARVERQRKGVEVGGENGNESGCNEDDWGDEEEDGRWVHKEENQKERNRLRRYHRGGKSLNMDQKEQRRDRVTHQTCERRFHHRHKGH